MSLDMSLRVEHDVTRHRYELLLDDEVVGVADYRDDGPTRTFFHTEIDRARRGQGLGDQLVRGALDDTRAAGRQVVPSCWFVADFVAAHAEYADLLAA